MPNPPTPRTPDAQGPADALYKDDHAALSMNEICINWNVPLVFLLAAMNM
jgi:hypothetical protein